MADSDGLFVTETGGKPAGAVILDEVCAAHVPAADEREIYLGLLITAREFTGARIGRRLIGDALDEARRRGVALVRVDCWAGGNGDLVRYYQGQGFTPTVQFDVGGWIGQVFERHG